MSIEVVTEIANKALYLIISIFQTVTSIQEQTLTFVPKIICVFLTLMIFGKWIITMIVEYMHELWNFSSYVSG